MDSSETKQFIQEVVKELWPKWAPSNAEIQIWQQSLNEHSWADAQAKVQAHYQAGGSKRTKPHLSDIMSSDARQSRTCWEIQTDVYCECSEHPGKPTLVGVRIGIFCRIGTDPEFKMRAAERMRTELASRRGGRWIVTRGRKEGIPDDGLRGRTAQKRAEEIIEQDDEDSPGQRFLRRGRRKPTDVLAAQGVLKTVDEALAAPIKEWEPPDFPDDDIPF